MSGSQAYLDNGLNSQAARVYDNVQAKLPAVQLPVIQMELWNVVQEFCRLSSYFRVEVNFFMQPGQQMVDFNPYSSDMSVYQVLDVKYLPSYRVEPPAMLINTGSVLTVTQGWALLALKPTEFGTLPPILFDLWFEAMLNGTLARLFAQPQKPYTNPQLAETHMRIFRAEVRRAKDQAERYNSGQQPTWCFPYFARGQRKN
jgi:hypothetical protein